MLLLVVLAGVGTLEEDSAMLEVVVRVFSVLDSVALVVTVLDATVREVAGAVVMSTEAGGVGDPGTLEIVVVRRADEVTTIDEV